MSQPLAQARLDYAALSATLFRKYLDFSLAIKVDERLGVLIDIRASQLNGCAFCLDMHIKQAASLGEPELRLHHVAIWRESALFSARERAALAWTEALTQIGAEGVPDALFNEVSEHFTPTELSELTFRVAAINGWNRLNVAFRNPPGSKDKAFGLDKVALR